MIPILVALALSAAPFQTAKVDAVHLSDDVARLARAEHAQGKQVLVVFGAPWCHACHTLEKKLGSLSPEPWMSKWVLVEVNVDDLPEGPVLGIDFDEVPYLMRLDENGRVAGTLRAGEVIGHQKDQGISALKRFLGA